MSNLVNTWGCVHDSGSIHPDYRHIFEAMRCFGATMHCIDNKDGLLVLDAHGVRFLAEPSGYTIWPSPDFSWGDHIVVVAKGIHGTISTIAWHRNEQRYFYYIQDETGRQLKKRYYAEDLRMDQ